MRPVPQRQSSSRKKQQVSPAHIALFTIAFLLLSVALLVFLTFLPEISISGSLLAPQVYYVVLLLLGLCVAGFVYGVLEITDSVVVQIKPWLKASGPVASIFAVIILGFSLAPFSEGFSVTVRLYNVATHQMVPGQDIVVLLDEKTERLRTNYDGEAELKQIPRRFWGECVPLALKGGNYHLLSDSEEKVCFSAPSIRVLCTNSSGSSTHQRRLQVARQLLGLVLPIRLAAAELLMDKPEIDMGWYLDGAIKQQILSQDLNQRVRLSGEDIQKLFPQTFTRDSHRLEFVQDRQFKDIIFERFIEFDGFLAGIDDIDAQHLSMEYVNRLRQFRHLNLFQWGKYIKYHDEGELHFVEMDLDQFLREFIWLYSNLSAVINVE